MIRFNRALQRNFASASPYKVLGVPESASAQQIKEAFVNLTKKYNFKIGVQKERLPGG